METPNPPSAQEIDTFWKHPDTHTYFADLELTLRSGTHLQASHPEQYMLVRFLRQHRHVLNHHFSTVYGWKLVQAGSLKEPYYFLTPLEKNSFRISPRFRRDFEPEYVIVALLLCKISLIDFQITEFASAEDLLQQLRDEYEPYREGLFRHLAYAKGDTETTPDEKKVVKWLKRCFKEFKQLGWLYERSNGSLEILPALDRIREMYHREISSLDAIYRKPPVQSAV